MNLSVINVGSRFGVCLNGNIARVFDSIGQAMNYARELRQQ